MFTDHCSFCAWFNGSIEFSWILSFFFHLARPWVNLEFLSESSISYGKVLYSLTKPLMVLFCNTVSTKQMHKKSGSCLIKFDDGKGWKVLILAQIALLVREGHLMTPIYFLASFSLHIIPQTAHLSLRYCHFVDNIFIFTFKKVFTE